VTDNKRLVVGTDEICQILGLTKQRIGQLVREGIIPKEGRGRYDVAACVQGYIAFCVDGAVAKTAKKEEVNAAELRLKTAKAAREEFDLKVKQGEYIHLDDATKKWEGVLASLRTQLLALPVKLATLVTGCTSLAETRGVLEDAVHDILRDLATTEPAHDADDADGDAPDDSQKPSATAAPKRKRVGGRKKKTVKRGKRGNRKVEDRPG